MSIHQAICKGVAGARSLGRRACGATIGALLLASCSTPTKPPSVDESTRRPVNARAAVDLKACQGELSRATLLVSELARTGTAGPALQETLPQQRSAPALPLAPPTDPAAVNLVAVVPFGVGSAIWRVEQADAAALVRRAQAAAVILIRGRTDATVDSLPETLLARRRAEAAALFLQQAGVPRDRLRLTWQGAGDAVAGLRSAERGQSRRVEIEFYAAAPVLVSLRSPDGVERRGGRGTGAAPAPEPARADSAASL